MGASHSKQDTEQVFYNTVPIQVSPQPPPTQSINNRSPRHTTQVSSELATQLSDTSLSPEVSPTRHALLDQSVRAKISAEAARLRGRTGADGDDANHGDDVDIVRREIEAALERENLDRERGMAGDAADGAHGDVKNSTVLLGDLEEIRQKVDRYRVRASLADNLGVKEAREAVASCYKYASTVSLLLPSFLLLFPTERIRQRLLIAGQKWLRFAVRWPSWSRLYPLRSSVV